MLLRQSVSSVAQQLLCACITADMRMHNRWCACDGQLLCTNIQTYDTPSSGTPSGLALQIMPVDLWNRWRVVKSGEEWVKSCCKLFTPRNADKHRGFRGKGEEWRVKACSLADKKWGASCFHERNRLRPWYYCLWVNEHPKIRTCR